MHYTNSYYDYSPMAIQYGVYSMIECPFKNDDYAYKLAYFHENV